MNASTHHGLLPPHPWPSQSASRCSQRPASAEDACTPGKTKKIAFMLKQQTAFRYLNADVPFFKKTAEAAGYEVLVQSAENDAQNQIAQAENVITQGVDAIVIQPVDFNVAGRHRRDGDQGRHPARLLRRPHPRRHAGRLYRPRPEGWRRRGRARGRRQGAEGQLRADRRRRRPDRLDPDAGGLPRRARPAGRPRATSRS